LGPQPPDQALSWTAPSIYAQQYRQYQDKLWRYNIGPIVPGG